MFDMSWGEMLVIGAVALIVIGPKDLPKALRTLGQMTTKVRRMAGEFQGQFNDAMREAELDEVREQVSDLNASVSAVTTPINPLQTIRDELRNSIESKPDDSRPEDLGPLPERTPAREAADAAAQPRGEHASPVPVEPTVAIPAATVPPLVDPAQSFGDAVEQGARPVPAASGFGGDKA